MEQVFYCGCVENRNDPLKLGRCQVRIVGLHTEDKTVLSTEELPWAYPLMPINSASISGLGWSPTGVVQGSWVLCIFLDPDNQQPIMIGTIGGIPSTRTAGFVNDAANTIISTDDTGELVDPTGYVVTDLIETVIETESPRKPIVHSVGSKYKVSALSPLTPDAPTTFIVTDLNETIIATATYDDTTKLYSVKLKRPENYTKEQYLPFTDVAPKTFPTTDSITTYFDQNF